MLAVGLGVLTLGPEARDTQRRLASRVMAWTDNDVGTVHSATGPILLNLSRGGLEVTDCSRAAELRCKWWAEAIATSSCRNTGTAVVRDLGVGLGRSSTI